MIASKLAVLAATAGFAGQALAFNAHRHLHQQVEKRAYEIDWVTVWETVVVTPGMESEAAPTEFVEDAPPSIPTTTSSTSTSTPVTSTTMVVPTTTQAPAPPPPPSPPPPAQPQTTLSKAPKHKQHKHPIGNGGGKAIIAPSVIPQPPTSPPPAPVESTTALLPTIPPASPTPSPSPSSQPPPPPSGSGGLFPSKRGLAYNDANLANFFETVCADCTWAWNWGSSSSGLDSKLQYVPMLWSPAEDHTSHWDSDAQAALSNGAKALFSFNECDNGGQCNMSPQDAATAHIQYMNKYAGKALIGAPSITNSGALNEGLDWLKQFFAACDSQGGCQVDFCNLHWYNIPGSEDDLLSHLEDAKNNVCGDRPIWLTEFGLTNASDDQVSDFLSSVLHSLDGLDYLEAYSYFMVSVGNLVSSVSSLSSFGQVYASA